jgi:protein phosphatase
MGLQTLEQETAAPQRGARDTKLDSIAPAGLAVNACGMTDTGRKRSNNEDQFLIAELGSALRARQTSLKQGCVQLSRPRGHLLVVADGVGGMAGGEAASALAVGVVEQVVLDALQGGAPREPAPEQAFLTRALTEADGRIHHEARRRPELHGMGTTMTLAYIAGREAVVAHVGDSRCYLHRDGQLYLLTRDHTLIAELVRRGTIRSEDAVQHSLRHVILNVIGGSEEGVQVDVHRVPLQAGDQLLLCSDGLTEMVSDADIRSILHVEKEPAYACQRLVERANANGGMDNVTVVVARFEE